MISSIFTTLLYQPLLNLLVYFYNLVPGHDLGIAIIILTIIIRLILYPLSAKSIKSQKSLQKLQPEIDKIKKKFKDDKEKMSKETMDYYRKNKINPLSSCLPLLIQFPVLIGIFRVLRDGINNPESLNLLYSFVNNPGKLDPSFLGFMDLGVRNVYLAVIAGAAQFWQSRMLLKKRKTQKQVKKSTSAMGDIASSMSSQMAYVMPVLTVFIALSFPAGLSLYWVVTTLFAIVQQKIIFSRKEKTEQVPALPSKEQ